MAISQQEFSMPLNEDSSSETAQTLLLTNDDGWDAPGLAALQRAAVKLGHCRIVAPSRPISGCGHCVTTDRPLVLTRLSEGGIAVDGTPADCVRLALHHLSPRPSWVLSGINAGGNLGTDIHHSGTVAAVREAVIHGIPGIAFSHYIARGRAIDWHEAGRWVEAVLRRLVAQPGEPGTFWNVNLPHPEPGQAEPEVIFCPLDPSPLPLRYRVEGERAVYAGDYQSRGRRPGCDVDVCFGGRITVTLIRVASDPLDVPGLRPPGQSHETDRPVTREIEMVLREGLADVGTGMP
jgi:5'-nucleotidase